MHGKPPNANDDNEFKKKLDPEIKSRDNADPLNLLPQDIINQLSTILDVKTLTIVPSVAKQWHAMFNNPAIWKLKISKDFEIPMQHLTAFMAKLPKEIDSPKTYKIIYKNLLELHNHEKLMIKPVYHSFTARDQENLFCLLACCTDDPQVFLQIIPQEERYLWLQLALYSCSHNIFTTLIKDLHANFGPLEVTNTTQTELWFCMASRAANKGAMAFLLDKMNGFVNSDLKWVLCRAINNAIYANKPHLLMMLHERYTNEFNESFLYDEYHLKSEAIPAFFGDVKLLKQLIQTTEEKAFLELFTMFLFTGNKDLINCFIDYLHNKQESIDGAVLLTAVYISYVSGNTDTLYHLLSAMSHEQIQALEEPNLHGLLYCAAHRGDLRLLKYLIEKHHIKPDQEILEVARDPSILAYLLDPTQQFGYKIDSISFDVCQPNVSSSFSSLARKFNIKPNQQILNDVAAYSLADVQFILDKKNGFNLSPNEDTLLSAFKGRNVPVIRFLLDPTQQFKIKFNEQDITTTLKSDTIKKIPFLEDEGQFFPLAEVISNTIVKILSCDIAIQAAIKKLTQDNFDAADDDFQQALSLSETHTLKCLNYIKQNPSSYHLTMEHVNFLNNYQPAQAPDAKTTYKNS